MLMWVIQFYAEILFFIFRSHMQDLQEVTHDLHYENYRATRLADGSDSDGHGKWGCICL